MSKKRSSDEFINAMSRGVLLLDKEGGINLANHIALRILQLDGSVFGARLADIWPELYQAAQSVFLSGASAKGLQLKKEGAAFAVDLDPVLEDGVPAEVIASIVSAKELEAAAQNLESWRERQTLLNAILDLGSDGMWICDGQGNVITINRASEKMVGVRAEDVVGRNMRELINNDMIDGSVTLKVLENKAQVNLLQYVKRTQKHLLLTGTPLLNEKGEISLVVINERDMTQLNYLKEQIQQNLMLTEKMKQELVDLSMRDLRGNQFIADSGPMRLVLDTANKFAHMDISNILLLGESGTGKTFLAKYIHDISSRKHKPFMQINCAALHDNLLEAELFGYEKGAFTGAGEHGKAGLLELAEGGTLFLDEIGEASPSTQSKLLKYLDDYEVLRVGGTRGRVVKCCIIAATNKDLGDQVRKGLFRQDLYYRLNTFTVVLPPLRQRSNDIFELARHFLAKFNKKYKVDRQVSYEGLDMLQSYSFPGNVRELESIIKRAVVLSPRDLLDQSIAEGLSRTRQTEPGVADKPKPDASLKEELDRLEKAMLRDAMHQCRSTREMAARLGISQASVVRKMKRHSLQRD